MERQVGRDSRAKVPRFSSRFQKKDVVKLHWYVWKDVGVPDVFPQECAV